MVCFGVEEFVGRVFYVFAYIYSSLTLFTEEEHLVDRFTSPQFSLAALVSLATYTTFSSKNSR